MVKDEAPYKGTAGTFDSALLIRYRSDRCADAGIQEEFYQLGLGMLRRVSDSIAGPQTYDLIYARIGKLRLAAISQDLVRGTRCTCAHGVELVGRLIAVANQRTLGIVQVCPGLMARRPLRARHAEPDNKKQGGGKTNGPAPVERAA